MPDDRREQMYDHLREHFGRADITAEDIGTAAALDVKIVSAQVGSQSLCDVYFCDIEVGSLVGAYFSALAFPVVNNPPPLRSHTLLTHTHTHTSRARAQYVPHAQLMLEAVGDLQAFIRMWRQHFIDTDPQV